MCDLDNVTRLHLYPVNYVYEFLTDVDTIYLQTKFELDRCIKNADLLSDRQNDININKHADKN